MTKSLSSIIDAILIFAVTAFFGIVLCGYFISGIMNIIFAAIAIAVCSTALILKFKAKKGINATPQIKNSLNQFIFNNKEFAHNKIKTALSKKHEVVDLKTHLKINSTLVFIRLSLGAISQKDLIEMYVLSKGTAKKIVVLTIDGMDKTAQALMPLLPDVKVHVLNGETVYRLLKSLDSLPKIEFELKKNKLRFKELINEATTPNKAKGYFMTALVLIISSLFVKISVYYLAAASICLTLGIISILDLVKKLNPT